MHFLEKLHTDEYDEEIAIVVATALAKSRGVTFEEIHSPDSIHDKIHTEALRVVAALRKMHN